jgi:hypothetical protein
LALAADVEQREIFKIPNRNSATFCVQKRSVKFKTKVKFDKKKLIKQVTAFKREVCSFWHRNALAKLSSVRGTRRL